MFLPIVLCTIIYEDFIFSCHIGKTKELDCAFIPLFPFERPHLQDSMTDVLELHIAIQKGMISRRSLHLRFNRQIDSVSSNLLDYLTNVDMFDHLAVGCTVFENGHCKQLLLLVLFVNEINLNGQNGQPLSRTHIIEIRLEHVFYISYLAYFRITMLMLRSL